MSWTTFVSLLIDTKIYIVESRGREESDRTLPGRGEETAFGLWPEALRALDVGSARVIRSGPGASENNNRWPVA
jgi:hypothetical protein